MSTKPNKLTPYAGWIVVAIAFVGLTAFVGNQSKPQTTKWVNGNDVANGPNTTSSNSEAIIGVRGNVDRVTTKSTGERTVHLITDDGAPVSIIIMPTVEARIPSTGNRIGVMGRMLGAGTIILDDRTKLTFLAPGFTQYTKDNSRPELSQQNPRTKDRRQIWTAKLVNRERTNNGAHWCTMQGEHGEFMGKTFVQAGVSLVSHPNDQLMALNGYTGTDGTNVVESIVPGNGEDD